MIIERVSHHHPARRSRGDTSLPVTPTQSGLDSGWIEYLWCKQISENIFELCCIPFYVYGVALDDKVEVNSGVGGERLFRIQAIVERSGHSTYWVWFGETANGSHDEGVLRDLVHLGCQVEQSPIDGSLFALGTSNDEMDAYVFEYLYQKQKEHRLRFTTAYSKLNIQTNAIVRHYQPAWRERSDSFVLAPIDASRERWEQLWVRKVTESHVEICCIPFFIYSLALGDTIETRRDGRVFHSLYHIIDQSEHHTFRILYDKSCNSAVRQDIRYELEQMGCLVEQFTNDYVAIDAEGELAQDVVDLLWNRQRAGVLVYEDGDAEGEDRIVVRGSKRRHCLEPRLE